MRVLALIALLAACRSKSQPAPAPAATNAPLAAADAAVAATLEGEISAIRDKLQLPAIGAAAWRDGKLLEQAVVGVRTVNDPSNKVTLDDQWHLGSNTKAMTATLIGIFVDRGALRWTDTIGQLLAPAKVKVDPGLKDVTLDQLIRHEGGFAADPPPLVWKQLFTDGPSPDARMNFVRSIVGAPPAHKPGTFEYSNTNYIVAGALLEAKTGQRWEELIKTELFDKLGMKSCGFGPPGTKGIVDQPRGHDAGGTAIEPGPAADNPPGLGPAGTVHCSLADYGKFLSMVAGGSPSLVSPETQQYLQTSRAEPGKMGYAGGWMVATKAKGMMLAHSGSNTMWYAIALVFPVAHLAFTVITNKMEPKLEDSVMMLLQRYRK